MKVLIVGGMHGNEPLGLAVVRLLQRKPLANVQAILANQEAVAANTRFTQVDLNRSFPGDKASKVYEEKRAAELLDVTHNFDLVLDFHNTHCPANDCAFAGASATSSLYDAAWMLGLDKVIVADYECINKYASNCLSIEISLSSEWNSPDIWYERILMLSRLEKIVVRSAITKYKFMYRITQEDKARLDLLSKNLEAFQPIDPELAQAMQVANPAYPIFIGDGYTPYNYGALLNQIN